MFETGLIGGLVVAETLGYRRAIFGRPPTRPMRLLSAALVSLAIHIGFHAAATAAPSGYSAIALVLAGWTTFYLWWRWMARAPKPRWDDDESGGGGGGGGGGSKPDGGDREPGGDGQDFDWDALEREMDVWLEPERELAGAR